MARHPFRVYVLAVIAGCTARALPPLAPTHPASPDAPEAHVPPPSTSLATAGALPARERRQATTYTCPMHPEIRQRAAGRCPRCGMDLVPADGAGGKHHAP